MLKKALALVMALSLALGAAAMAEENAFGWEVPEETLRIYIFYTIFQCAIGIIYRKRWPCKSTFVLITWTKRR